ncbi:hypothetical protein [Chitinasiproducens palmae]|uniref:Lipoprotein n=1 Tax=Chitinasiproducens palmae TaxID=1770053 RepID=A0A1H2PLJ0_9BURK|nr:hypothetical protein [Chitinasiproducens palmae]SDV47352.1 hypothetical protein SAMN05216551_102507 [Chitinasiproducens palmae]
MNRTTESINTCKTRLAVIPMLAFACLLAACGGGSDVGKPGNAPGTTPDNPASTPTPGSGASAPQMRCAP